MTDTRDKLDRRDKYGTHDKHDKHIDELIEQELLATDEVTSLDDQVSSFDEHVPMLTDVLRLPRYQDQELPAQLDDVNWSELAERIRSNVMERLMRRSTLLLDEQLGDGLNAVIERATENLAAELRSALSSMVKDLVYTAVDEELNRVHTEIAKRSSP